jgi:hypothetical protein
MVRPQLHRAFAAFALISVLSLSPTATANAAVDASRSRVDQSSFSWLSVSPLRSFLLQLLEKAGVQIDPEGHK